MGDAKVYKDQCAFCFHTPEMNDGLFICVNHKFAYCPRHVKIHNETEKCKKYVRFVRLRRRLDKGDSGDQGEQQEQPPDSKITKLAIGLEGGCLLEPKFEFCDTWTVVDNYPQVLEKPVDPNDVQVQNIIKAESAYRLRELEALAGTWDGSALIETKHKNLMQLPFSGKIPTKSWRCQFDDGCDKTENLWMNLTDGKILCGRRNFDGSGGNNHALEHFNKTKYPLAVNLGTITPQTADVYSYDEDEMVLDPNLNNHLKHFGINMMQMEKTEKTMLEKELDLNKTWEYASIQEDGHKLEPVFGPGFTGIHNLGNSCYMNSLLQSFVQMPEVVTPIVNKADEIFRRCKENPYDNVWVQTAKIFSALMSGEYSFSAEKASHKEGFEPPESGIRPYDFRHVIGKNHVEFATKKQQDVEEYMRYLSEKFRTCLNDLNSSIPGSDPLLPACYLAHVVEDNGKTIYYTPDCVYDVDFDVKPRPKTNETFERPVVNLMQRLKEMMERPETIKTGRIVRFATFPRYLLIKVNRHSITDDWQPVKLDYSLEVDEAMDIEFMRGPVPKPNDRVLIDKKQPPAKRPSRSPSPALNAENVSLLMSMGFTENACRKALKSANNDVTSALDWIMARAGDPNLDLPEVRSETGGSGGAQVDAQCLNMLLESGFSEAKAKRALRKCNNNIEAAFSYLLDGEGARDDVPPDSPPVRSRSVTPPPDLGLLDKLRAIDGRGSYKLTGVISHIGSSTKTGHYVYHGLKNGSRWAIFNDEKVAWSESPPLAFGYVYVFKRADVP